MQSQTDNFKVDCAFTNEISTKLKESSQLCADPQWERITYVLPDSHSSNMLIMLPKSLGSKPQVAAACAKWACTEYLLFLTRKQETTYPLE